MSRTQARLTRASARLREREGESRARGGRERAPRRRAVVRECQVGPQECGTSKWLPVTLVIYGRVSLCCRPCDGIRARTSRPQEAHRGAAARRAGPLVYVAPAGPAPLLPCVCPAPRTARYRERERESESASERERKRARVPVPVRIIGGCCCPSAAQQDRRLAAAAAAAVEGDPRSTGSMRRPRRV